MRYSWTDYPIDVGTDLIDDTHFQEAETNLNIELDRRGLSPIDLGTLDVIDDLDMETLRQGIEEAESPSGCSDHYYSYEDAKQSDVDGTYNGTHRNDVDITNEADHRFSVDNVHDSSANSNHDDPFDTSGDSSHCPSHNTPVYSDYQHAEYGANYYWDCGSKKVTVDSTNDVNVNLTQDGDVLINYHDVHLQSMLTNMQITVDDAQNFSECSTHDSSNQAGYDSIYNIYHDVRENSGHYSTEDETAHSSNETNYMQVDHPTVANEKQSSLFEYDYSSHQGLWYFAFCDSNLLTHNSSDNPGDLAGVCPFHYTSDNPNQCSSVDYPYCEINYPGCADECTQHHDIYEWGAAFGYYLTAYYDNCPTWYGGYNWDVDGTQYTDLQNGFCLPVNVTVQSYHNDNHDHPMDNVHFWSDDISV